MVKNVTTNPSVRSIAMLLCLSTCITRLTLTAHGNGGGYFIRGVDQTGMIQSFQPEGTEHVAIIQEDLTIILQPTSARVEVRYVLRNLSNQKTRVRFGFPVEEIMKSKGESLRLSPNPNAPITFPTKLEACRDYRIELGGKALDTKFIAQDTQPDERFIGLRGWLVSEARFEREEEKTLTIRFEAAYMKTGYGVEGESSISEQVFKYRLSTGAAWNGPIQNGRVTLRTDGIPLSEVVIKNPVNRFKRTEDSWEWSFRDLEPTLEDDLVIEAIPKFTEYSWRTIDGRHSDGNVAPVRLVDFIQSGNRWFVVHGNYTITASSTLPNEGDISYRPENLRSYEGTWSEGSLGSGAGEWIELKPEVPQPLDAILIRSGHEFQNRFELNARPCLVEIKLNGDHSFQFTLENSQDEQIIPVVEYAKPVRVARLTFLSAYEGTEHKDMCLAQVRLRSVLSKAPKVEPSR